MSDEIDISNVPLTPRGKNYDFNAVKNYTFVRFDETIKFRLSALTTDEPYISDNEVDLNTLETDEEKVNAIINSPMVEVRKKRPSNATFTSQGEIRLNPKRTDLIEMSNGCYSDYKFSRRNTISFMEPKSLDSTNKRVKRQSLPIHITDNKENDEINEDVMPDHDFQLLVTAIDNSESLLEAENKRLGDMINDWSYILEIEAIDIPEEIQGDIKSAVGGLQVLMSKRFKSTIKLLELAAKFVNNKGVKQDDEERSYRAEDIYAYVDLLIMEIKKADEEFGNLLIKRNNHWCEPTTVDKSRETTIPPVTGETDLKGKRVVKHKNVKSRINVKELRAKFMKSQAVDSAPLEEQSSNISTPDSTLNKTVSTRTSGGGVNTSKITPTQTRKVGVRSKAVLKKLTGTPVHEDTPRPRRSRPSTRFQDFVVPLNTSTSVLRKKRNIANSSLAESEMNTADPVSTPSKRPRKSTKPE